MLMKYSVENFKVIMEIPTNGVDDIRLVHVCLGEVISDHSIKRQNPRPSNSKESILPHIRPNEIYLNGKLLEVKSTSHKGDSEDFSGKCDSDGNCLIESWGHGEPNISSDNPAEIAIPTPIKRYTKAKLLNEYDKLILELSK